MENKEQKSLDSQSIVKIRFSPCEEKDCYVSLRRKIIKLLYMIEGEQNGESCADLFLYGLMFELASANKLCNNKLTNVVIKIHGLYEKDAYKSMTHDQIKRQIMESKGILDHLISDIEKSEKK